MANVLVTIISKETIPNILVIKQWQDKIDSHIFIYTKEMVNQLKDVKVVCNINPNKSKDILIDADDFSDLERQMKQVQLEEDNHYLVNITGGNKIMALSVFQYFNTKDTEIVYIPFNNKNTASQIFPVIKANLRDKKIGYRLNVKEYFNAYGLKIQNENSMFSLDYSEEFTKTFFEKEYAILYQDQWREITRLWVLAEKQHKKDKKKGVVNEIAIPNVINNAIKAINLPAHIDGKLTVKEKEYLTGGWFEEYMFVFLRDKFKIEENHIAINVMFKNKYKDTNPNELDVVFTLNNTIYVFECKSGAYTKQDFEKFVYKFDSVRQDLGLSNQANLVVYDGIRDINDKTKIVLGYQKRATAQKVNLFDRFNLEQFNL